MADPRKAFLQRMMSGSQAQKAGSGDDVARLRKEIQRLQDKVDRKGDCECPSPSASGPYGSDRTKTKLGDQRQGVGLVPSGDTVVATQTVDLVEADAGSEKVIEIEDSDLVTGEHLCALAIIGLEDIQLASEIAITFRVNRRRQIGGLREFPLNFAVGSLAEPQSVIPLNGNRMPSGKPLFAHLTIGDGFDDDASFKMQLVAGRDCASTIGGSNVYR